MIKLTLLLAVALLSAALAQVPVTRWHNNPAFELPYGAMRSDGPTCDRLIERVGQAGNETGVCYAWLDSMGGAVYQLFTMQAQLAGYVITHEQVLPDPVRGVLLVIVSDALVELVFFMYEGQSAVAIAFSEEH